MNPQTDEQLNMANKAAKELGLGNISEAVKRLDANTLASNSEFQVEPQRPNTEAAGLNALIETEANSFTENLARQADQQETQANQSFDQLLQGMLSTPGETALTDTAYSQEGGVDDIQGELNDINQQILSEQNSLRRRLEAIEKNPTGMSSQAVLDEQNRVERESLKKQADLSIVQMGIQGRFDSAKAIADRAVSAQLEQQANRNAALRLNYERNQDLFDKKEQRAFEAAQSDRERALDEERDRLTRINEQALLAQQNGAPGAVVQSILNSQTPEQAAALASNFTAPLIQEQQQRERDRFALEQGRFSLEARRVAMAERESVFNRAMSGDPAAIDELGYDPNGIPGGIEGARQYETQTADIQMGLETAERLMSNMQGLQLSTGAFQSPLISSLGKNVPTGTGIGLAAGSFIPGVGTLVGTGLGFASGLGVGLTTGYADQKNAQMDFLSGVSFLVNDTTFAEIRDLRAQGVTFGNMTEGERVAAGRAAQQLNAAVEIDESGKVIGINDTAENVQKYIADIQNAYLGRQEYLNAQYAITPDEGMEGYNIWNQ